MAVLPNLDTISLLQMDTKLPAEAYEKVLHLAMEGGKAVGAFLREELLSHTQRRAAYRGDLMA